MHGEEGAPRGAGPGGTGVGGKRWAVVAVAVAVVALLGIGGVLFVSRMDDASVRAGQSTPLPSESGAGGSGDSTVGAGGDPTGQASGGPTTSPTGEPSGGPTTSPTGEPTSGPTGDATGEDGGKASAPAEDPDGNRIPDGWRRYRNQAGGFSVAMPRGWRAVKNPQRDSVTFSGPGTPGSMIVEWTVPEGDHATPADHWRALEREILRKGEFPGYERIAIRSIEYRGRPAADWEFTRSRDGAPIRVVNRGFTTADGRPFALYWETTASRWQRDRRFFETFTATFRPVR